MSLYRIQLTSQQWRTAEEVDHPYWTHSLILAVPQDVKFNSALLTISGGNLGAPFASDFTLLKKQAERLNMIAAIMTMVPNQPLRFSNEKDARYVNTGRKEDALVAYTWNEYLNGGDDKWPLRLPMTKAVVRAMDVIQSFAKSNLSTPRPIETFILTGTSKRGWTALTAAAVDKRVKVVIPVAIDLADLKHAFKRHYETYGAWSVALKDYLDFGIDSKLDDPRFDGLLSIESIASYHDRLGVPKYILQAAGDEFFLPDSSRHYLEKLPGMTHLLYLTNTNHNLDGSNYADAVIAYIHQILNRPLPSVTWRLLPDHILEVTSSEVPSKIILREAANDKLRDFRHSTTGPCWKESWLTPKSSSKQFRFQLESPEAGWKAGFVEFIFDNDPGYPLRISTDVFILPEYTICK